MNNIFNGDNRFFRALGKIVDCIFLSILFIGCSIPMMFAGYMFFGVIRLGNPLTIIDLLIFLAGGSLAMLFVGPALSALYYVAVKNLRHGHGYAWSEYWHGYKDSFKQGAACGVILYFILFVLCLDTYYIYMNYYNGAFGAICWVFLIIFLFVIMWATYIFSYIARFENTTSAILKNSMLIMIASLPKSFAQAVMFLIIALAVYFVWPSIFIFPAAYMVSKSYILEKTLRKYMSEEDIAAEDERNQEFKN